ncbi:MAG: biotin transporter BioY [Pseudanabaenaceae cyanobacterium bins.68]|nr:biotin transporter BioY [Pseudanabaenaceae cyanobacterium bins.68]
MIKRPPQPPQLFVAIWTVVGLALTITGTFFQPHLFLGSLFQVNTTLQVGAVLLTGCVGGKNAGLFSQLAYVGLGLAGFPFFYFGGGLDYLRSPAIGFLFGLIPGAWLCGYFAFLKPPSLSRLFFCCSTGLGVIHGVGIIWLICTKLPHFSVITDLVWQHSLRLLPGQLVVMAAAILIAKLFRSVLAY